MVHVVLKENTTNTTYKHYYHTQHQQLLFSGFGLLITQKLHYAKS